MPYQFLVIPFRESEGGFSDEALRKIEETHEIKSCQVNFFQTNKNAYWTAFVEYTGKNPASPKKKAKLSPEQEVFYEALRKWRNELAEAEGVPPYVIAHNRQLEKIVALEEFTIQGLLNIKGFGKSKIEKYGKDMIKVLHEAKAQHEAE